MADKDNFCFVQFIHPGGEHEPDENGRISWNTGKHKRKFLKQKGVYLNRHGKEVPGDIMFWSEWEPQSKVVEKIDEPISYGPRYIYEPYYNLEEIKNNNAGNTQGSCGKYQNTDPFVFGDRFFYGICQQKAKPSMRNLEKGSVIIFGSGKGGRFIVDTIFVVGDYVNYKTKDCLKILRDKVPQEYIDVVLKPFSESKEAKSDKEYRLYISATYKHPYDGMYSYFPCKSYEKGMKGFKRPNIQVGGITQTLTQGINGSRDGCSKEKIKEIWEKVTGQIIKKGLKKGLMLGIRAEMPREE